MDNHSVTGITPLSGELSDGICEAVLVSAHPRGRSDTICNIVQEICETIAWFHGSTAANDQELTSLHQLLEEAQAHRQRMAGADGPASRSGARFRNTSHGLARATPPEQVRFTS